MTFVTLRASRGSDRSTVWAMSLALFFGLGCFGYAGLARADAALDRAMVRHHAIKLGYGLGYVTVLHHKLTDKVVDEETRRLVRKLEKDFNGRAQLMGLQEVNWQQGRRPAEGSLAAGVKTAESIADQLHARFGASARAVFFLGFDLTIASQSVPLLSDDEKSVLIGRQNQLIAAADLEPGLFIDYQDALRRDSSSEAIDILEQTMTKVLSAIDDSILDHPDMRRLRLNVFRAGSSIAAAALGAAHNADSNAVEGMFEKARAYARNARLSVTGMEFPVLAIPQLPEAGRTSSEILASTVHYLLQEQTWAFDVDGFYGEAVSALAELGIKTNLMIVLYGSDDIGKGLAQAISRSLVQSRLPASVWQSLVESIEKQIPHDDYKREVTAFGEAVIAHLESSAQSAQIVPAAQSPGTAPTLTEVDASAGAWALGAKLGLATIIYFRGTPTSENLLSDAQRIGRLLGIDVKPFPVRSTDTSGWLLEALSFFNEGDGRVVAVELNRKFGDRAAILYSISSRIFILTLVYDLDPELGAKVALDIKESCERVALPQHLWSPLTDKVTQRASFEEIRSAAADMDESTLNHLLSSNRNR